MTQDASVESIISTNAEELMEVGEKIVTFLGNQPFTYTYFSILTTEPPDVVENCKLYQAQPYRIIPGDDEDDNILLLQLDNGEEPMVYIDHTKVTFYHNEGRIVFADIINDQDITTDEFVLKK